jgi:hypothetical protein
MKCRAGLSSNVWTTYIRWNQHTKGFPAGTGPLVQESGVLDPKNMFIVTLLLSMRTSAHFKEGVKLNSNSSLDLTQSSN